MNRMILAFPRSGTKLLADAHKQNGYHSYGEFFNTYSVDILPDNTCTRVASSEQKKLRNSKNILGINLFEWNHAMAIRERYERFKTIQVTPSIVTVWQATFDLAPETIELTDTRTVLCLRRKNTLDQLLSRCVTVTNLNHDAETESSAVLIEKKKFEYYFHSLMRLNKMQEWCVSTNRGFWVDFDELIAGQANIGFEYTVNSVDQHAVIKDYVQNYTEVVDWHGEMMEKYTKEIHFH